MSVTSTTNNTSSTTNQTTQSSTTRTTSTNTAHQNPNATLSKDDFLKLLLVELQYQDPTEPMDSEKILTQTSELATLESTENTNKALENLSASLASSQQFSTISAIGKTADLGTDAISHQKAATTEFEVYFPNSIKNGTVNITDSHNHVVRTISVGTNPAGVYKFTWDGKDQSGHVVDGGIYHVNSTYTDTSNKTQRTRLGVYPIESVKFDSGNTLVKVGSSYVPIDRVREIY